MSGATQHPRRGPEPCLIHLFNSNSRVAHLLCLEYPSPLSTPLSPLPKTPLLSILAPTYFVTDTSYLFISLLCISYLPLHLYYFQYLSYLVLSCFYVLLLFSSVSFSFSLVASILWWFCRVCSGGGWAGFLSLLRFFSSLFGCLWDI